MKVREIWAGKSVQVSSALKTGLGGDSTKKCPQPPESCSKAVDAENVDHVLCRDAVSTEAPKLSFSAVRVSLLHHGLIQISQNPLSIFPQGYVPSYPQNFVTHFMITFGSHDSPHQSEL